MNELPVKLCKCGCGGPAPIAKNTDKTRGYRKGEPTRYIRGHNGGKRREMKDGMAKCCGCGKWKSVSDYSVDKRTLLGITGRCRKCDRLRYERLTEEEKKNRSSRNSMNLLLHPQAVRIYSKRYRETHPDRIRRINRKGVHFLKKCYLKRMIRRKSGLRFKEITDEMIDIKRFQLTIKRLIRQLKKGVSDGSDGERDE